MRIRGVVPISVFFLTLLTVAAQSRAECGNGSTAAWFFISNMNDDPGVPYADYCQLWLEGPFSTLIVGAYAVPFRIARITLPDPPFGTIVAENWFFPHTGDRATGLEFDLEGCSPAGRVVLGEIYVVADFSEVDPASCQSWTEGTCEIQSCEDRWLPAQFIPQRLGGPSTFDCICYGWQFCYSLAPYVLYPPDGATDVPLNAVLTWAGGEGWDCGVRIGTDPTCDSMQGYSVPCDAEAFAPDFLQPYTTYYWHPWWVSDGQWGCAGSAAVHSFTTGETINAVKQSTWGHVKALYR